MGLLAKLRHLFRAAVRRWPAAVTHDHNSHHWTDPAADSINDDLVADLATLRTRAKTELARNPLFEGIVDTHAAAVCGPAGPTLRVLTDSDTYNQDLEALWAEWWKAPAWNRNLHGADLLRMCVRNFWTCGEYFFKMEADRAATGIRFRLAPVRPDRVAGPLGKVGDENHVLGITFDTHGRPRTYYVDETPVPADQMIHGFRLTEEDQARGFPWAATILDTLADLREYDVQVLDAAKAAADHALILVAKHPDAPYIENNEEIEIRRRRIMHAVPGWEPMQVQAQQPAAQYVEYRRERLAELGRPVSMPLMLVRLTAESHNYSSARMDKELFHAAVRTIQAGLTHTLLNRCVEAVRREGTLRMKLRPLPGDTQTVRYAWTWPAPPHVDPAKEATAERMRLENGTLAWEDAAAAHGQDPDELFAKLERDTERRKTVVLPKFPQEPEAEPEADEDEDDQTPDTERETDDAGDD